MPSFDIVSEVDKHALMNSVDQANRLITTRFDFKGVNAKFDLDGYIVTMWADAEFQLEQMFDVVISILHKNKIDIKCLDLGEVRPLGKQVRRDVTVRTGLDADISRKIVKLVKDKQLKVQVQIQGEQVRVTGKKRDDLQGVIAVLRNEDVGMPLQFTNMRD